jgi:hypothetical protein
MALLGNSWIFLSSSVLFLLESSSRRPHVFAAHVLPHAGTVLFTFTVSPMKLFVVRVGLERNSRTIEALGQDPSAILCIEQRCPSVIGGGESSG